MTTNHIKKACSVLLVTLFIGTAFTSSFGGSTSPSDPQTSTHSLSNIPQFIDGDGHVGTYQDYLVRQGNTPFQVRKVFESSQNQRSVYPTLLVFINASLAVQIQPELVVYISTLQTVGYAPILIEVTGGTPEDLKNQITSYWTNPEYNLTGAVLIGNLPVAWYFNLYDNEGQPAEFPCDLFLMDLDGTWHYNESIGMYDSHSNGAGDTSPEVFTGRIDASNVPGDEIILTKDYLHKVHEFWVGNITHTNRGLTYTDHDWAQFSDFRHDMHYMYDNYDAFWWPDVNRDDYVYNRLPDTYEFIQIACHAGYSSSQHNFNIGGIASSYDVRTAPPNALFYNIFTCSSLRFTEFDCLGNGYVLNTSSPSLTCVGSTKVGSMLDFRYFYQPIAAGACFGDAFRQWFTYEAPYSADDIIWFYGMVILGDPTLVPTREMVPPEIQNQYQNQSIIQKGDSITLGAQARDYSGLAWAQLATNESGTWMNCTDAYGSPVYLHDINGTWVWTNFTWQNWDVPQGRTVGWKIYYNDSNQNINVTDIMSFSIKKNPVIYGYSPLVTSTGVEFVFNASVYDDDDISSVFVEYWYDAQSHFNVSMVPTGIGTYYEYLITIPTTASVLHYVISAQDATGLWSDTGEVIVPIHDTLLPEWCNQGQSSAVIQPGGAVTLSAQGRDNIGVAYAYLSTNESGEWIAYNMETWWNNSWQYSKKIVINHTLVVEDLTDFPVLISYTSSDFTAHAQTDGDDFVFATDNNATTCAHEIESYNPSTGELVAWVDVPVLRSSEDTVLYVYYGNPDCTNQENPSATWSNGYLMVHHMDGAAYPDLDDSTANHWDVTSMGGNPVFNQPGKISTCVEYDGSGDYLKASLFRLLQDSSYTASIWAYVDGNQGTRRYFFEGDADAAVSVNVWTNETFKCRTHTSDAWPVCYSSTHVSVSNPQWYYVSACLDADTDLLSLLINGVLEDTTPITGTVNPETTGLNIGTDMNNANYWMNGKLDELRISSVVRSTAWIRTEYNSMSQPAVFASIGEEIPIGPGFSYGSPLNLSASSYEWAWSNFTWQNPEIPQGRTIGWTITYVDTSNNRMSTPVMSFSIGGNTPPNRPFKPRGPTAGITNRVYNYTTAATDPDGDSVYYLWDWGDGNTSGWFGPYPSLAKTKASYQWAHRGVYWVKVKAKDVHGAESDWSDPLRVRIHGLFDNAIALNE